MKAKYAKSNFAEHIIFKGKCDFFLWPTGSWSTETNESQVLITTSRKHTYCRFHMTVKKGKKKKLSYSIFRH